MMAEFRRILIDGEIVIGERTLDVLGYPPAAAAR